MKPTDIDGFIHDAGQPTSHFNVLKELGKDSKRVIVDETAQMYFVGMSDIYTPMLFIIAEDDLFGRYEQTMLMVKTLEHFGHKENIYLKVMKTKHCEYVCQKDNSGNSIFANIILSFINRL